MKNINSKEKKPIVFFLMGPTGCGKSKIAIYLRKYLPIEIISVDSALIYRNMNIGTDKPDTSDLKKHPHRLLNIKDPTEIYSAAEFRKDALKEISSILSIGKIPFLVGGTMFYYKTLLHGISDLPRPNIEIRKYLLRKKKNNKNFLYEKLISIDPISANRIHQNDTQRLIRALEIFYLSGRTLTFLKNKKNNYLPYDIIQYSILPKNKLWLYQKIEMRVKKILMLGFQKEVENLFFRRDIHKNLPSMRCIGYRQMWEYLEYKISYEEMFKKIIFATRKLAKHQITWLKKWKNVHYFYDNNPNYLLNKILEIIK
ncbi:tRNA dimethylallyltransferase [Buchnera aphidicola (Hyalopterus amygdali)]